MVMIVQNKQCRLNIKNYIKNLTNKNSFYLFNQYPY